MQVCQAKKKKERKTDISMQQFCQHVSKLWGNVLRPIWSAIASICYCIVVVRHFLDFLWKQKNTQPPCNIQVLKPLLPYLSAAAAVAGRSYHCYIIRSGPERLVSPITEFRSHLIWLLHSVSSLPCLLLHRLLKSPHASEHTHTHTHTHAILCPHSPSTEHSGQTWC